MNKQALTFATICVLAAFCATGCGSMRYFDVEEIPAAREPIQNPLPALTALSLAPVLAPEEYSKRDWTSQLNQSLLGVSGIDHVFLVEWPDDSVGASKLPKLADASQGLLQLKILDFNPYYPPSAHVEVDFYVPRGVREIEESVLELERHGSAPTSSSSNSRRTPWVRFQKTIRATDPGTAKRLRVYAASASDQQRGMSPEDRVLRVSDRFMEFVMHETLSECFARIGTKEKETNGFLREFLAGSAQ